MDLKRIGTQVVLLNGLILLVAGSYHGRPSYPKLDGDMRAHIRKVLNIGADSTLADHLDAYFNLKNPNPMYVFLLPDKINYSNRIILRRTDFGEPNFPDVTENRKAEQESHLTWDRKASTAQLMATTGDDDNPNLFNPDRKDLEDDEMVMRVLQENIRTERSFIETVQEYNRLGGRSPSDQNGRDVSLVRLQNRKNPVSQSSGGWESLGLDGWSGGLKAVVEHQFNAASDDTFPKNDTRPSTAQLVGHQVATKALSNATPLLYREKPPPPSPQSVSSHRSTPTNLNREHGSRAQFPLTSVRAAHHDADVFIARANNPFGHSTKWNFSNSTINDISSELQASQIVSENRFKRGAVELYSMIKCATGCDPLIFKGYGCYCGFLGAGHALDGVDRCCKIHDHCYENSFCPTYLEYFVPYIWKCYRGKPVCAVDHGEWGGPRSCARRLCECDVALSKCLRRYYCPRKRQVCQSSSWRLLQSYLMDAIDF